MEQVFDKKTALAPVCAYRRKNGFCLLHKTDCSCTDTCAACPERLRPERTVGHGAARAWQRKLPDLSTKAKRFRFRTRNVCKYAVFRTCTGKRRFRDEPAALEMARRLYRRKGWVLAVYECPFCGGFHLTRQLRPNLPHVHVRPAPEQEEVA